MADRPDETVVDITKVSGGVSFAEPTTHLRFVMRNGQRILQQAWERKRWANGKPTTWEQEWRDIKLELEP